MTAALTWIHRWLGVALCLMFAMWFASGIVMHFVPFPSLTEAERVAGLAPVDLARVTHGPADAVTAGRIADATRVRLIQRSDGPVYVVSGRSGVTALHAVDLSRATVASPVLALAIAIEHAQRRGLRAGNTSAVQVDDRDQWTVAGDLDRHRPLYRVALGDDAGTELYISSATGEVVRDTTHRERWWNALGSIPHWLYPTALRSRPQLWSTVLWTLSLAGTIAALAGSVLGISRIRRQGGQLLSPYRGWHAWHHLGGLACMTFVLTWMFSGFLSMDDGLLFPGAKLVGSEAAILTAAPPIGSWPRGAPQGASGSAKEIEWFGLNGRIYRRDRLALARQRLEPVDGPPVSDVDDLRPSEITALARRLGPHCTTSIVDPRTDAYAAAASVPGAPVYRVACGEVWLHIDGASGAVLDRLDASRRAYRWLYRALHTLDVPALTAHPALRSTLIVMLCGCGFLFSLTGCVIGWRRLRVSFRR
jgi:hypothetical protein